MVKISSYSQIIVDEAKRKGIKATYIGPFRKMFLLQRGDKHTFIFESLTELVSKPHFKICSNKYLTATFLKKNGFKIAPFVLAENFEQAKSFLQKNKQVVVKPLYGNQGRGITVGVKTIKDLKEAYKKAFERNNKVAKAKYKNKVLVEKMLPGEDHRVLVMDYKDIYAIKKTPAYVIGDGKSTITELVDQKNKKKVKHKKPIVLDQEAGRVIGDQGYKKISIPEKGQQVFIKKTANLATGGESIDITDELSPEIRKIAIEAAKKLKMPVVGLDFMTTDYKNKAGIIIDINPTPGLLIHHYPHVGKERNPSRKLIEMLISKKLI